MMNHTCKTLPREMIVRVKTDINWFWWVRVLCRLMAVPLSWQFLCLFLLILLSECYGSSSPCASLVSKCCDVWLTICLLSWLGMTWAVILAEGQSVNCFPSLLSQLWKAQLFNLSSDVIFFGKSFLTPQARQGFLLPLNCTFKNV